VARYDVFLARDVVASQGGRDGVADRVRAALEATELPVVRRIDGIGKRVDVRDFLRRLTIAGPERAAEAAARAGIAGDLMVLEAEVDVRGSGGVKIAEVVEATFKDALLPHRAIRTALGRANADGGIVAPLELALLRTGRAAAKADESATVPGVVG
jgi:hypothetical protein